MSLFGIVVSAIILSLLLYFHQKNKMLVAKIFIAICLFQNMFLVLMSRNLRENDLLLITGAKEAYIYLQIGLYYIGKKRFEKTEFVGIIGMLALLICAILNVLVGDYPIRAVVTSYRQLSLPFLFFLYGRILGLNKETVKELLNYWIKIIGWTMIFAVIEFVGGDEFWEKLGIKEYMIIKYGEPQIIFGHYNYGGFYTYDLYPIFGRMVKRISSTTVDAVIYGQLIAFTCVILISLPKYIDMKKIQRRIYLLIALLVLVGTFAKGGYLICALSILIIYSLDNNPNKKIIAMMGTIIGFILVIFFVSYSYQHGLSGTAHIRGITESISVFIKHPFGQGIGSAGNLAKQYGNKEITISGESFVGAMMVQLGFMGLAIYLCFINRICKFNRRQDKLTLTIKVLTIALFVNSIINNTAISFTSCYIFFIFSSMRGNAYETSNCISKL